MMKEEHSNQIEKAFTEKMGQIDSTVDVDDPVFVLSMRLTESYAFYCIRQLATDQGNAMSEDEQAQRGIQMAIEHFFDTSCVSLLNNLSMKIYDIDIGLLIQNHLPAMRFCGMTPEAIIKICCENVGLLTILPVAALLLERGDLSLDELLKIAPNGNAFNFENPMHWLQMETEEDTPEDEIFRQVEKIVNNARQYLKGEQHDSSLLPNSLCLHLIHQGFSLQEIAADSINALALKALKQNSQLTSVVILLENKPFLSSHEILSGDHESSVKQPAAGMQEISEQLALNHLLTKIMIVHEEDAINVDNGEEIEYEPDVPICMAQYEFDSNEGVPEFQYANLVCLVEGIKQIKSIKTVQLVEISGDSAKSSTISIEPADVVKKPAVGVDDLVQLQRFFRDRDAMLQEGILQEPYIAIQSLEDEILSALQNKRHASADKHKCVNVANDSPSEKSNHKVSTRAKVLMALIAGDIKGDILVDVAWQLKQLCAVFKDHAEQSIETLYDEVDDQYSDIVEGTEGLRETDFELQKDILKAILGIVTLISQGPITHDHFTEVMKQWLSQLSANQQQLANPGVDDEDQSYQQLSERIVHTFLPFSDLHAVEMYALLTDSCSAGKEQNGSQSFEKTELMTAPPHFFSFARHYLLYRAERFLLHPQNNLDESATLSRDELIKSAVDHGVSRLGAYFTSNDITGVNLGTLEVLSNKPYLVFIAIFWCDLDLETLLNINDPRLFSIFPMVAPLLSTKKLSVEDLLKVNVHAWSPSLLESGENWLNPPFIRDDASQATDVVRPNIALQFRKTIDQKIPNALSYILRKAYDSDALPKSPFFRLLAQGSLTVDQMETIVDLISGYGFDWSTGVSWTEKYCELLSAPSIQLCLSYNKITPEELCDKDNFHALERVSVLPLPQIEVLFNVLGKYFESTKLMSFNKMAKLALSNKDLKSVVIELDGAYPVEGHHVSKEQPVRLMHLCDDLVKHPSLAHVLVVSDMHPVAGDDQSGCYEVTDDDMSNLSNCLNNNPNIRSLHLYGSTSAQSKMPAVETMSRYGANGLREFKFCETGAGLEWIELIVLFTAIADNTSLMRMGWARFDKLIKDPAVIMQNITLVEICSDDSFAAPLVKRNIAIWEKLENLNNMITKHMRSGNLSLVDATQGLFKHKPVQEAGGKYLEAFNWLERLNAGVEVFGVDGSSMSLPIDGEPGNSILSTMLSWASFVQSITKMDEEAVIFNAQELSKAGKGFGSTVCFHGPWKEAARQYEEFMIEMAYTKKGKVEKGTDDYSGAAYFSCVNNSNEFAGFVINKLEESGINNDKIAQWLDLSNIDVANEGMGLSLDILSGLIKGLNTIDEQEANRYMVTPPPEKKEATQDLSELSYVIIYYFAQVIKSVVEAGIQDGLSKEIMLVDLKGCSTICQAIKSAVVVDALVPTVPTQATATNYGRLHRPSAEHSEAGASDLEIEAASSENMSPENQALTMAKAKGS